MTHPSEKHGAYRPWAVRTVVVRLSRKLTATYRLRSGRVLSQLLTALLAGFSTLATALPEGASLVAGQANVSTPNANAMVVTQGSDKAILNWQSFNIGAGQSMQYVQPGAASVALNRVTGAAPSSIYGSLSANGQVFLINPAGVMFAPGAQVHVGGLVASTLALSNEDFMAGRYTFSSSGNAGAVTNGGNIRAARGGYVLLAAPNVSNTGSINADAGSVGLVAGARVSVDTSGAGLVSFSVDAAAANAVAANSGVITAQGGQVAVLASALGDAMATVINQSGVIRATSVTERNGVIVLSGGKTGVVAVNGELNASGADGGQTGGTVKVLGDKVVLAAGARIDTSGQSGGGTVLIGGNYQGKGAEQNASLALVARDVVIDASATGSGDGGKVVVWSDAATGFYGAIKASGGSDSGHGGFAEVSGKQTLAFDGSANLGAARGETGTLLLDPLNIVVSNAGPATYADVSTFAAQSGTTQTVSVATLNAVAGNITLQASNDITLSNTLAVTGSRSVSLEANNNINVNAALSVTGAGAINLKADADNSGTGTLALGAALTSQAGGITLSGASVTSTAAGSITTTGAGNANAGQLTITSAGAVNLAGTITATGGTAGAGLVGRAGGAVNITGVGGVTTAGISASGSTGGTGSTDGGAAGSITVANSGSGNIVTGALTAQTGNARGTGTGGAAGNISATNSAAGGNLNTGAISTAGGAGGNGGAVTLSSQAGVTVTGTLGTSGTVLAAGTRAGSNAGNITITGVNRSVTGAITASGSAANGTDQAGGNAGVVSITGSGTLGTSTITASTGGATGTGTGGAAGSLTLTGSNTSLGALSTVGGANGNGGAVSVTATGTLSASTIATGGGTAQAGTAGRNAGSVTLQAGAALTAAAITAGGSAGNGANQAGGNGAAVSVSSTGGSVAVGSITTTGGNGVAGVAAGGNAGAITLDAAGAGLGITLASNLSAVGGSATGGAAVGSGGAVQIDAGTGTYTQNNNIDVTAGSGSIAVIADTVNIGTTNAGSNALATSGVLTIKAKTAGRTMSLAGASGFDIAANEILAFATGATGSIVIGDSASTGVMTIGAPVNLAGKTLTLNAGSIVDTGTQTITATNVTLNANGNIGSSGDRINVTATNLGVNTTAGGNAFVASGAINMGVGSAASNVAGTLDLLAGGAVTQTASTGNITAGTLKVQNSAANSPITLTNSGNNAGKIDLQATSAGAIQYTDVNGFDVAALTTTGNATLSAGGAVTQSGAISASGLALTGAGGNHTLRHAGNAVTTLAANTGSIDYSQTGALTVGTVAGVVGVTTAVAAKIETTGAASDLTLTNAVTSNGTGDAIVLKAGSSNAAGTSTGGKLVNSVGASGIAASAGRYLVYSGDPGTTTEGVTGYNKRYNTSSSFTPGGSANMFLYRIAPTLTINTDNVTRVYGDANPVFTGSPTTGFIDGDTDASVGVYRSTSAVFNTPVAVGPVTITPGATNNENYTLVLNNGLLTITRRSIPRVTGITGYNKVVDGNTGATLNTGAAGFSNMVMGDRLNVATATGNFDNPSVGSNKTVFITGITLGGDSLDNYTLMDSTARTTASIRDLSSFTGGLFPVSSPGAALPKSFASSGLTVASANALLESAPTAAGGCGAQITMLREPTGQQAGSASVTVTSALDGLGSGFCFSLPADFLGGGGPLQATTPTGAPLPEWLRFDATSRSFVASGAPAGALPMQIRVSAGDRAVVLTISDAPREGPPRGVLVEHRAPVPAERPG